MGMAVAHLRLEQENRQQPYEHAVAGVQLCKFHTIAFGTEGGLFDQAGIHTVVCGPGSMEQGHKPDEFI